MTDIGRAMQAIRIVEENAPNKSSAQCRLLEIATEAKYRADHINDDEGSA